MPRKQNGFGNSKSFAFKGAGRVDRGKGVGAFGFYPSDRQYGTSVHRSVVENWNLNSGWTKWRRGYELYNVAAFSTLNVPNEDYDPGLPEDTNGDGEKDNPAYRPAQLESLLYQGTDYPIQTLFRAIEMPTLQSDVNTRYVVKRFVNPGEADLGTITGRSTAQLEEQQRKYQEVWFKGTAASSGRSRLLLQMLNERLTDNETEATLKNILSYSTNLNKDIPAVYKGKTPTVFGVEETGLQETTIELRMPIDSITIETNQGNTRIVDQGLNTYTIPEPRFQSLEDIDELEGKVVYIPNFFKDKKIDDVSSVDWVDYDTYFGITVEDKVNEGEVYILDPGVSTLPPSMYDISQLPKVLSSTQGEYTLKGSYVFLKDEYQRFFGRQYFTAGLIEKEIESLSYSVLPFLILGASIDNGYLSLKSVPFTSEIKLYTDTTDPTLVFHDKSFVKYTTPHNPEFRKAIDTNVSPWQDEVFASGNILMPADIYTCDCPSYSKTILAMPQAEQNDGERKANRQARYPLPTAMSANRFQNLGIDKVAGKATTWARPSDNNSYKYCKHTVTGMFYDKVQMIEPSQYPTAVERVLFEEKLEKELESLDNAWKYSAKRGGISLTEIVFSLAQGLNLDDVETGYVVLNSN